MEPYCLDDERPISPVTRRGDRGIARSHRAAGVIWPFYKPTFRDK
jgi:hypothetical protein